VIINLLIAIALVIGLFYLMVKFWRISIVVGVILCAAVAYAAYRYEESTHVKPLAEIDRASYVLHIDRKGERTVFVTEYSMDSCVREMKRRARDMEAEKHVDETKLWCETVPPWTPAKTTSIKKP
jgi:hypothetical protein